MAQIRERVLTSGRKTFEARIHLGGMPAKSKSFASKREAQKWVREVEGGARRPSEESPKTLFSELVREWLVRQRAEAKKVDPDPEGWEHDLHWLMAHSAAPRRELYRVRQLAHDWGKFSIEEITRARIERWLEKLAGLDVAPQAGKKKDHYLYKGAEPRKYAASTRRKWFYTLKKLLDWHAARHNYILPANLYNDLEIPAAWAQERERRLEPGEEERLASAAATGYTNRAEWPLLIGFALETAMRAQELLKAEWRHADLGKRNLRIPKENSKTGRGRDIPLSKRAVAILKELRGDGKPADARIFWPWQDSNILARGFRRLCHRAGIDDLKIHDLRHEATSRFFERGKLDSVLIKKITGHESMDTLSRYFQLRPGTLHELMD